MGKEENQAFKEGVEAGRKADLVDEALHALGDILVPTGICPKEEQSRDAGWHKGNSEK